MIRHLFSFAFAASLLLCVVTAGLWVRSYFVADAFYNRRVRTQPQDIRRLEVDGEALRGRFEVRLKYLHFWPPPPRAVPISLATASPRELGAIRRRAFLENVQAAAAFQRISVEVSQTPPPYWYSMSANAAGTGVKTGSPKLTWSWNRSEEDIAWTASLNAPHWLVVALMAIFAASFWWFARSTPPHVRTELLHRLRLQPYGQRQRHLPRMWNTGPERTRRRTPRGKL